MATVVKATEHVLVETATAVVSSLGACATAEFKTLESGIAQEAVSATDEGVSNIIDKVGGAVETVVEEVVNGAEHVVETVKQHPELIAEGVLAVGIGVASLVQPELIAGEIAILGKMAADSAKKTVTQIATDEGQKIVKAISKDLSEDAKAEAEKDKVQAEEKRKAEGGDVVNDEALKLPESTDVKPVAGEKNISIEIQHPATKPEGAADVKSEKDAAPMALKITIGSDGEIKAVSKSVVQETEPKPTEVKEVLPVKSEGIVPQPELVSAPVTKEIEIQVIPEVVTAKVQTLPSEVQVVEKEPPKAAIITVQSPGLSEPAQTESTIEPVPVPAQKAVETSESVNAPMASTISDAAEVVEPEILSVLGITHSDVLSESWTTQVPAVIETPSALESEKAESFVEQLFHRSNSGEPIVPAEKADEETVSTQQIASVECVSEAKEPSVEPERNLEMKSEESIAAPTSVEDFVEPKSVQPEQVPTICEPESVIPTSSSQQGTPEVKSSVPESSQRTAGDRATPVPLAISQAKDLAISALESSTTENGPALVASASVTNITKTLTKTVENPSSSGVPMVTVTQESLEILHSKLDAMHEAIQLITKHLATHLPAPHAPRPVAAKGVKVEIEIESPPAPVPQAAPIPAVRDPETPLQPSSTPEDEIIPIPTPTDTAPMPCTLAEALPNTPQPTTPKRPTHVKRGSVIGSIGKFLWPFGGAAPAPKGALVKVDTVEASGELEVQAASPKSISKGPMKSMAPESSGTLNVFKASSIESSLNQLEELTLNTPNKRFID